MHYVVEAASPPFPPHHHHLPWNTRLTCCSSVVLRELMLYTMIECSRACTCLHGATAYALLAAHPHPTTLSCVHIGQHPDHRGSSFSCLLLLLPVCQLRSPEVNVRVQEHAGVPEDQQQRRRSMIEKSTQLGAATALPWCL